VATGIQPLTAADVADICASFQQSVVDTLEERVGRSLLRFRKEFPDIARPSLVVAGGVAANAAIRTKLEELCRQNSFAFVAPPLDLCTDNAAMIAWAGLERLRANPGAADDGMEAVPRSRWPLDEAAAPLIGAGRRGAKA
jgi:N6-L-threonylcarbamoyladenine synthase